eukprot:scaffold14224_cov96-Isochrysis_galbana.AAC.7
MAPSGGGRAPQEGLISPGRGRAPGGGWTVPGGGPGLPANRVLSERLIPSEIVRLRPDDAGACLTARMRTRPAAGVGRMTALVVCVLGFLCHRCRPDCEFVRVQGWGKTALAEGVKTGVGIRAPHRPIDPMVRDKLAGCRHSDGAVPAARERDRRALAATGLSGRRRPVRVCIVQPQGLRSNARSESARRSCV